MKKNTILMKKILLSILLLSPFFLVAQQARVLNGQYNDGQSFGKPIPDTVRTLVATSPLSIASGGASLVDTIKSSGSGTPAGSNGYIQFNNSGSFGASSNLFWDNTNSRLGLGGVPSYPLHIQTNANSTQRIRIENINTGYAAVAQIDAGNGTGSFKEGVTSTGFTPNGLLVPNTVFFQSSAASRLLFQSVSTTAPIIFASGTDGLGNTEIMRMFVNGTVAIAQNTDSTSGKLVVGGNIVAGNNIIDATNNRIGVNTKVPIHALDVQGASGNTIVGVGDNFGTAPLIYLQADATNGVVSFNSRRNYPFAILVNNTEYIRTLTTGNTGFGLTVPTAIIHIKAGTATAGTAPLKFTSGINLTTSEAGAMEYDGNNLFFTPSSAVRNALLMTASVNTVSPTSPNRTLTVVINGTTYYIPAKTSND
jgi:hypothetical protein